VVWLSKNRESVSLKHIPELYRKNLRKNLSLIKEKDPSLYSRLFNLDVEEFLEESKDGALTLRIRNLYIESRYNPIKGSSRYIKKSIKANSFFIFIGSGLGYHINTLFKAIRFNGIIIERDINIFKVACYIIEPECLKNLILLVGKKDKSIVRIIKNLPGNRVQIIRHRQSYGLNKAFYNSIEGLINKSIEGSIASNITEIGFKRLWMRNILKNLANIDNRCCGTKEFYRLFKGPVILVASGPFLEDSIERIKDASKSIPIISLLPSVSYLLNNGIRPDFIVTTDAGFGNRYRWLTQVDIPMITTYSLDPGLFKNWMGDRFLFSHSLSLENTLSIVNSFSLEIPMQGTSSLAMIMLARMMGFSAIYIAGFDFAYNGINDHHQGGGFDSYFQSVANRFKNWHTYIVKRLKNDRMLKVQDHFGNDIYSTYKLILYRDWFENELVKEDLYRLNNGANIKSINTRFEESLDNYGHETKSKFTEDLHSNRYQIDKTVVREDFIRIRDFLLRNHGGLEAIYRLFYGSIKGDIEKEEIEEDVKYALLNFYRYLSVMENR